MVRCTSLVVLALASVASAQQFRLQFFLGLNCLPANKKQTVLITKDQCVNFNNGFTGVVIDDVEGHAGAYTFRQYVSTLGATVCTPSELRWSIDNVVPSGACTNGGNGQAGNSVMLSLVNVVTPTHTPLPPKGWTSTGVISGSSPPYTSPGGATIYPCLCASRVLTLGGQFKVTANTTYATAGLQVLPQWKDATGNSLCLVSAVTNLGIGLTYTTASNGQKGWTGTSATTLYSSGQAVAGLSMSFTPTTVPHTSSAVMTFSFPQLSGPPTVINCASTVTSLWL